MISPLDIVSLLIPLLLLLGFAFGWNNSGLTTGNLSNILDYNLALVLTVAGVFVGVLALGEKMSSSIIGNLVSVSIPETAIFAGVAVSVGLLILLTLFQLPVSLSNCTVGSFIGAALASNSLVNARDVAEVVGSWIIAPLLCALVTVLAYRIVLRLENNVALCTISVVNRILLIFAVFYVSFALGGNNIGVILSFAKLSPLSESSLPLELGIFISSSLGMILFGRSIAKIVSDRIIGLSQLKTMSCMLATAIITTVFTSLSIPVSLTQVIIGGMVGAGVAHRPSALNNRELTTLIAGWTLVTIASVGLGFALTHLLE